MENIYHTIAHSVIKDLQELKDLTADQSGAHRVAWTPFWDKALEWFSDKMQTFGAEISKDSAYNIYAKIPGKKEDALCIGSHLDSVPGGGWLDGALGVVAGIGVARYLHTIEQKPKHTLYIVNWADEEGARFGRSCFGSSAVSGTIDPNSIAKLRDIDDISFSDVLSHYGLTSAGLLTAKETFLTKQIRKYIELHIEQAPLMERRMQSVACVSGICGCVREYITFSGQRSHLGCPIEMRHDAFLAAAEAALSFRDIAKKYSTDEYLSYCTVGQVHVQPNIINVVPDYCSISLDIRTINQEALRAMENEIHMICKTIAASNNVTVDFQPIWAISPTHFDKNLIERCQNAIAIETGHNNMPQMISGPLHDAAELSKCVPSIMMFAPSKNGLSHCKEEDTSFKDLEISISAFIRLAENLLCE